MYLQAQRPILRMPAFGSETAAIVSAPLMEGLNVRLDKADGSSISWKPEGESDIRIVITRLPQESGEPEIEYQDLRQDQNIRLTPQGRILSATAGSGDGPRPIDPGQAKDIVQNGLWREFRREA
jgi:hypothetical protein